MGDAFAIASQPNASPQKGGKPAGREDGRRARLAGSTGAGHTQGVRSACAGRGRHVRAATPPPAPKPHTRPLSLSPSPSPKGRVATGRGGRKPLDRPDILLPVVGGLKGPNSLFHSRILPRCHPPFWGEALGPGGVKYIFSLTASV